MGIPRKGSRKVTFQGKAYRYMVKETHIEDHKDQKELSVTIQEDVERPGRVLQARLGYGESVTTPVVEQLISAGLQRGWEPTARGTAFLLKD